MRADDCAEMRLLVQADTDGELGPGDAARVEAHLEQCPACAALWADLTTLAERIRRDVPVYEPSDQFAAAVRARIAALSAPEAPADRLASWRGRFSRPGLTSFGGGFALAACLALAIVIPRGGGLPEAVVSDHIRALQPGHLMDVVSTDQHTVKPWFDGRLDFAPPVNDFKSQGFPLEGGRLDYLAGKPVAALIYKRRQHVIDVYVWPDNGGLGAGPVEGSRSGYNYVRWRQNGMAFWAVSDLAPDELTDFVRLMRKE